MFLQNLIPRLPASLTEAIIYIVALLGMLLIIYGIFLERERRQDIVIMLGALCLLDYALYIKNTIFIIAMSGIALASLIELIEILVGIHKHTLTNLKEYKNVK